MEEDQGQPEERSMSSLDLQDGWQPAVKLEEEGIYVQIKEEEIPTQISQDPGDTMTGDEEERRAEPEDGNPLYMMPGKAGSGRSWRWDISLERLISVVHERPELWDSECPRYSDRYRKKKVWDEVCALLTPDWHILSDRHKKQRAKDIQTRWRSARDRYRRDLNESQGKGSPGNQKKKPYVFFKDLSFLKRSMEMREYTCVLFNRKGKNANNTEDDDDFYEPPRTHAEGDAPEAPEVNEREEPTPPPAVHTSPAPSPPAAPGFHPSAPKASRASKKHKMAAGPPDDFECKIMAMMASMQERQKRYHEEQRKRLAENPPEADLFRNVNDDDVAFLRSLLPYLRRAPESKKLDLRISVLNVVSQFVDGCLYDNSPPSSVETQYSDHSAFLPTQHAAPARYDRASYGSVPAASSSYSHVSSTSTSYQNSHPGQHGESSYTYPTSSPSPRPYMQDL
ncbi:uncharacterized protein ACMZJ9_015428 [Mantella aurantiaca]